MTGTATGIRFLQKRRTKVIKPGFNNGQDATTQQSKDKKNKNTDLVNGMIKFPSVLVIGPNGEQLGVMSSRDAQMKANAYELDLLCVAPNANPPVVKIINYGKYRFEQQKKAKENRKNQERIEIKEIRLTPQTGIHDLETKARQATKFLEDGNKVKVSVRFKGRQMSHIDVGEETLNKFIEMLSAVSVIEKPAVLDGKFLSVTLGPKKSK